MLCWNVYIGDFNSGDFEVWNIFNHYTFYNECVKAKKKYKEDREGFEKEVKSWLHYCFWSKCEWEIVLQHWPSGELYDMRKELTIGQLRDALRESGIEYNVHNWSKDDRKIEIRVFPRDTRFREKKIDVCEQVMNNWDVFIDYLWNNRKELKARK